MEKKQSLLANALIFGALTGVTLIILSGILNMTNNAESPARYLGLLLLAAGIVIGTLNYRDKIQGGYAGFGKCLSTGVLISLMAGVLAAIFVFVYMTYINPGMIEQMMEKVQAQWEKQGLTSEQIEQASSMAKRFMGPGIMTVFTVIGYGIMGTIIALIASAFIKKDPPLFNNSLDQPLQ
jgi:hypothetical protein